MKNKKVIFLHSMFRAGSTYLFNKYRTNEMFWVFYEPLHHDLIRLRRDSLDIWRYDKKATKVMNHPELEKPHFFEYQSAFNESNEILPFFDTDFSYKEFFEVCNTTVFKAYIDNLIDSVNEQRIPVFQFNRTSLRIDWFKEAYQDSLNVFLLRNPRDQFESYYQRNKITNNIFLAINLYVILNDINATKYLLPDKENIEFSNNVVDDLDYCMSMLKDISLNKHYEIFYFIWLNSFLHAKKYADIVLDMDKLNHDNAYLNDVEKEMQEYSGSTINFDDYKITQNNRFTLDLSEKIKIEKQLETHCQINLGDLDYKIHHNDYNAKDQKKSLLKRLILTFSRNK